MADSVKLTVETGQTIAAGEFITINLNGKAERVITNFSGDVDGVAQANLTSGQTSHFLQHAEATFTGRVDATFENDPINPGDPVSLVLVANVQYVVASQNNPIGIATSGLAGPGTTTGPVTVMIDLPNEAAGKEKLSKVVTQTNFLHGDGLWPLPNLNERNAQAVVTPTTGKTVEVSDYFALIDGYFVGHGSLRKLDLTKPAHTYTILGTGEIFLAIAPAFRHKDHDDDDNGEAHVQGKIVESTTKFGNGYINIAKVTTTATAITAIDHIRDYLCDIDEICEGLAILQGQPIAADIGEIKNDVLKMALAIRDLVFQNNLTRLFITNPTYKDMVLRNFLSSSEIDLGNTTAQYDSIGQELEFPGGSPGRVVYYNPDTKKIEDRRVLTDTLIFDVDVSNANADLDLRMENAEQIKPYRMLDGNYLVSYDVSSGSAVRARAVIIDKITKLKTFKYEPVGPGGQVNRVLFDAIEEVTYTSNNPATAAATGCLIIAGGEEDSSVYAINTVGPLAEQWRIGTHVFHGSQSDTMHNRVILPKSVDNTLDNNVLVCDLGRVKAYSKTTGCIMRYHGLFSSGCVPPNAAGQTTWQAVQNKRASGSMAVGVRGIHYADDFRALASLHGVQLLASPSGLLTQTTFIPGGTLSGSPTAGSTSVGVFGAITATTGSASGGGFFRNISGVDEADAGGTVGRVVGYVRGFVFGTPSSIPSRVGYADVGSDTLLWSKDFTNPGTGCFSAQSSTARARGVDWVEDASALAQTVVARDNAFVATANVTKIILEANEFKTGNSTITYEASNDNGATFAPITKGVQHTFASAVGDKNDVVIRATMNRGTVTLFSDLPRILDWGYVFSIV